MTHFYEHNTRSPEAPSHFGIGLVSLGGGCFLSGRNVEVIFDVCNPRSRPCRTFHFFLFSPRTDLAPQPNRIALDIKNNPAGVDGGVAAEGLLDPFFHIGWRRVGCNFDEVADAGHSLQFLDRRFSPPFLELPAHLAFDRDPSGRDGYSDLVRWN